MISGHTERRTCQDKGSSQGAFVLLVPKGQAVDHPGEEPSFERSKEETDDDQRRKTVH